MGQGLLDQIGPIAQSARVFNQSFGKSFAALYSEPLLRALRNPPRSAKNRPRPGYGPYEYLTSGDPLVATDLRSFLKAEATISEKHAAHKLVWRGQADASWPVHSTLYRAVVRRNGAELLGRATEDELVEAEKDILGEFNSWGLGGLPLSGVARLAELQHFGAPTRLLGVSLDPTVAAWFAVHDEKHDDDDAFLLAWGLRSRESRQKMSEAPAISVSANFGDPDWWEWEDDEERVQRFWGTGQFLHHWFPFEPNLRMRAQRGGFLIDSGPIVTDPVLKTINDHLNSDWRLDEVQRASSIPGLPTAGTRKTTPNDARLTPLFTILIESKAKPAIRSHLESRGLTSRSLFPDMPGVADHLRSKWPAG